VVASVDASELTLTIDLDIEDGGATISDVVLEVAAGLASDSYSEVASYNGEASITLDQVADGLVYGTIYKFRYYAVNEEGSGPTSPVLNVAMNAVPAAPSTPVRSEASSSETSIALSWNDVSEDPVLDGNRITGYRLYAAKDQSNIFTLIYDGSTIPTVRSKIVTELETGSRYDFKVSAINFNGECPTSDVLTTYSCLAPSGIPNPVLDIAQSTYSAVRLTWS
jgi:hypothetical protein